MKIFVGILLILHGLITAMQSGGSFNPTGGVANPKWLGWWPTALGQSWLLIRLGLEKSAAGTVAGMMWLLAGAALIAAGLGLFGFIVPSPWWRLLAGIGAALSLLFFYLRASLFPRRRRGQPGHPDRASVDEVARALNNFGESDLSTNLNLYDGIQ